MLSSRTGRQRRTWAEGDPTSVVLDPSERFAWSLGRPGFLTRVGLGPAGRVRRFRLHGADTRLTGIAFDRSGHAYYTAADNDFGRLDLRRFVTHRWYSNFPAADGVVYDRFSGDLVLAGNGEVVQIDPRTLRMVSLLNLNRALARQRQDGQTSGRVCDQMSTDNRAGLAVACGDAVVLLTMSGAGLVDSPHTAITIDRLRAQLTGITPTFVGVTAKTRRRRACPHLCRRPEPHFTG